MQVNWEEQLRSAYSAHALERGLRPRSVRLPSGISLSGDQEQLQVSLCDQGVTANMQADPAAFEGWCLVLQRWCGIKRISLRWSVPSCSAPESDRRHYQRFLYRVARFRELFPWIDLSPEGEREVRCGKALTKQPLWLNVAHPRPVEQDQAAAGSSESALEHRLLKSPDFTNHYGLKGGVRDRQLPVGLFSADPPTRASQVFPAGKGAIDLVALHDAVLWVFELKAGRNIPVGALTEVFFYTSMLRDALQGGPFSFAPIHSDARLQPDVLAKVSQIQAVILGHALHPLIDTKLMSVLSEAADQNWNIAADRVKVGFRAARIDPADETRITAVG